VAVPESFITRSIQNSMEDGNIGIGLTGVRKTVFFALAIERVVLTERHHAGTRQPAGSGTQPIPSQRERGEELPLLIVEHLDIAPDLPSFLKLSPRFLFSGRAGGGLIHGTLGGVGRGAEIVIDGTGLTVGGLPVFAGIGIYGEGTVAFNFRGQDSRGAITFSIDHAKLSGGLAGFEAIPLNRFQNVKGMLALGQKITVNSLTMEGRGIYVRVKGEVKASNIDGRAEIMLNSSFDEYSLLSAVLDQYKVSPGYYVVPLSQGNLFSNREP
jgi:type II secretion system protein N